MADNLLDKASILLTPTAYNDGRMLSVKPEVAFGEELSTNGDFSNGTTGWSNGSSTLSVVDGKLKILATGAFSYARQNITVVSGKKYKITVNFFYNSLVGNIEVYDGTTNTISEQLSKDGVITLSITPSSTNLRLTLLNRNGVSGDFNYWDNVSVVEDLSGDFTFSRSSAATRVNAQGLVENVQIISSELVSNGNFSQIGTEEVSNGNFSQEGSELVTNGDFATDSDWNIVNNTGTASEIINGYARIKTDGAYTQIDQPNVTIAAKSYKLQYTISESDGGSLGFIITGNQTASIPTTVGTHVYYFVANSTSIVFKRFSGVLDVKIDNISVKEVGQDWTLETGWSIGDGSLVANSVTTGLAFQSNIVEANKSYKATYSVVVTSGSVGLYFDGGTGYQGVVTTTQTITVFFKATTTSPLYFRSNTSNFTGSITNISVKEVGQDWTFGTGWSMEDRAFYNDSATNQLSQSISLTSGVKYKLTFDIELDTVNQAYIWIGNSGGSVNYTGTNYVFYPTGSHTVYFTMPSSQTTLAFYGNQTGGAFYITNISVKEITDDTDLPRINYEGFSYQDSLGSEEVVNGDFSNGLTNWYVDDGTSWTNVNNTAFCDGNNGLIAQNHTLTQNKVYKVTFDSVATNSSGKELGVRIANGTYSWNLYPTGTHTIYLTAGSSGTQGVLFYATNGWTGSIDNVSVKEVLGQEVVPDSGCGSWLLEPQSTNLIPYSEDFSQWVSIDGVVITDNFTTSPDGTQNASKLVFNGTANSRIELQVSSSGTNAQSVYLKTESGTQNVSIGSSSTNLTEFTITDQWVRYTHTGSGTYPRILCSDAATIYVWGCQYESGDTSTSYIPSNGATNTRLQDIANNSGNSTLINSTEGVLYAEIKALNENGGNRYISLSDGTDSNRILLRFQDTDKVGCYVRSTSGYEAQIDKTSASISSSFLKVAVKWKTNDVALWVNGVEVGVDSSFTTFNANVLDRLNFTGTNGTSQYFYGKNKALAVYKEALTDANLRSLTYPNPVATTFDLDFDTIAEQFTFTRGSEATFVNAQGLIESTASNDAPRIDYSTGAKAFLLENQSTNLVTYSEDLSDSSWLKASSGNASIPSVTSNYSVSPDGTLNASRVVFDLNGGTTSSDFSQLQHNISSTSGLSHTSSVYMKSNNDNTYNLTFIPVSGSTTIVSVTPQWKRFDLSANLSSSNMRIRTRGSESSSDVTDISIWGAQLEQKSYATSYIPTSGATATRNQELCNNATPVINSEEGTLYAEISALADDLSFRVVSISDGTNNNTIKLGYRSDTNAIYVEVKSASVGTVFLVYTTTSITDFHKIAFKYRLNDFSLWIDGVNVLNDSSGSVPIGLSQLSFNRGDVNNSFFGNTKGLKYYPKALADVQLEDLTTI